MLFPVALVALGVVLFVALRHRILAVMAWRNTQRRRRQSALVVLGLLVGTALISGALVAGDSMEYAIVEATYQAFLEVDETVHLDGYNFFPQGVEDELRANPRLGAVTDAVGSNIIWDASAVNLGSNLYEPRVRLVGFDPAADVGFGAFRGDAGRFTGETLAADEVVLNEKLADALEARVGDRLELNFTLPVDPLLPSLERKSGQIALSAGGVPPLFQYVEPQPWSDTFHVRPGTVRLSAILTWNPGAGGQDLDLRLVAPDGTERRNVNGTATQPDVPAVLNVTGSLAEPLPSGTWTVRVSAEAAADTAFQVALLTFTPVYDLETFDERAGELEEEFGDFELPDAGGLPGRETRVVTVAFLTSGGKGPDFALPTALNLYVRMDTLQQWLGRPGEVNFVKVSNLGGVESGARRTGEVMPILEAAVNESKAAFPGHPAVEALRADDDKRFWLSQAEQVGELFSVFLTSVASFSVVAGLLLIINIFTMLAEERKGELGISRAVGLRRSDLTRAFTLEGALYALPAAVLGTFFGLGLAAVLIWGFNFFGEEGFFPRIPFRLDPDSLLLAFATGILLTLGTVYVGARRASKLNIVRAIRNLEEPEHVRTRFGLAVGIFLASVGGAVAAVALLTSNFTAIVFGPSLVAVGVGLFLRRWFQRRVVYPFVALALFAYLTSTIFLIESYDSVEGNVVGPIRAVIMAICVVIVVVYNERAARAVGAVAAKIKPLRTVAMVSTSYPLHRKFRTGMTLSMYSVILLVVSLFTIFGTLFTPDPEREAGSYDVQGFAHIPFDRLEDHGDPAFLERVDHYSALRYSLRYGGDVITVENETPGQFGPPRDTIFAMDQAFARENGFALLRKDDRYPNDAAAYEAVVASDDLAVVAYPYSTDEQGNDDVHKVGDTLQVRARGGVKEFRIAGIQEQSHFKGIWISERALDALGVNVETMVLVALREGEDADAAAKDLEAGYRDVGMDAASIRTVVNEENRQFRQIFTLIQLFLGLGLVVGILSLGIVTARSVIERRQEIGMMRAVGYLRRDIRRAFLLEILTMVTMGVAIGAALAILVSFGLWVSIVRELRIPYTVPWDELAIIAGICYVATTLATLAPILRAARVPPAEALRYIE